MPGMKNFTECYADNSTYADALISECISNPSITNITECNSAVGSSTIVAPGDFTCDLA
eukprot:Pgem_evm1s13740